MMQPNWTTAINRFLEFVENNCEYEIIDYGSAEANTPVKRRPFMPNDRIEEYFTRRNYNEFREIIYALFPRSGPFHPQTILTNHTSIFCTLLSIGEGAYIEHFRHYDSLSDSSLPFNPTSPPANLPAAAREPKFLHSFCAAQWKFCAVILKDPVADKRFEHDRVLPIIEKKRLAGGGSATLWLVKIYSSYNKLISEETKVVCSCQSLLE